MATKYEQAMREEAMVTPKKLAEAKERALERHRLAYAPQLIKQPDGTVKELCWMARIDRAYILLTKERTAGNSAQAAAIEKAMVQLRQAATLACAEAEKAFNAYATMAVSAGQKQVDDFSVDCHCEGCIAGAAQRSMWAAEATMRRAVWELLVPDLSDDDALPAIVKMDMEQIRSVGDKIKAFVAACREARERPNWRDSLSLEW